jgi:YVTN family beta-propeller protein
VRALPIGILIAMVGACSSSPTAKPTTSTRATTTVSSTVAPRPGGSTVPPVFAVREVHVADLAHAVQDVAAGTVAGGVLSVAGIDASGSTNRAFVVTGSLIHNVAPFPLRLHDAAAASVGGALYVFGGGDGVKQLDGIWRVDGTGAAQRVATLPAASSDSSAAAIGDTAYVVGGYTGRQWLDTVVAYRPGTAPRVVAHLPEPRRYAAVASDGHGIYVFGGSAPTSNATSTVFRVDVGTGRVVQVATLPAPITHAAAAPLGGRLVLAGGHGASTATLSSAIVALDPTSNAVSTVGRLNDARSDLAMAVDGARAVVIGGHTAAGRSAVVGALELLGAQTVSVNVYAHTTAHDMSAAVRGERSLVYVPNSVSNTVDVIDPATFRVVDHFSVGSQPQHVAPSWDLQTLYVDNDRGNSLTPLDPRTGRRKGADIPVTDPYNLYFTPDGRSAIVVAERLRHLDFRDPHTMALTTSLSVPCRGVDHLDFTADGTIALASCEFSAQMVAIDIVHRRVLSAVALPTGSHPQDVKLSPDGRVFCVADMTANGIWLIDAKSFMVQRFVATGRGAHGLYPSRDARVLYVTNRDEGTISVFDFATARVTAKWPIPHGSPDMGGVSANGQVLWLSGRYNAEVYAVSTGDGRLLARIPVGAGPHGLCVWPQPGRYSIGHTGNTR